MLLSTLAAGLLGKCINRTSIIRAGEGRIRAGQNFNGASSFN